MGLLHVHASSTAMFILSSYLLFFSTWHHASRVAAADPPELVDKVCKQSQNYTFCVGIFESDPRASSGDPRDIVNIPFDLALSSAIDTEKYITKLLGNNLAPKVRENLLRCDDEYRKGIGSIQTAILDLVAGTYKELSLMATLAYANARTCERLFIEGPTGQSPLTSNNENLMSLCDICTVAPSILV